MFYLPFSDCFHCKCVGGISLLCSAPSHFFVHLMLQQHAGSRSHISVTFLLSGGGLQLSPRGISSLSDPGASMDPDSVLFSVPGCSECSQTFIIPKSTHSDPETLVTAGNTLIVPAATVACTTTECISREAASYRSHFSGSKTTK